MFDRCINSRYIGNVGVAAAIYYFTRQGMTVSVPLTDSQRYDLVVDDAGVLKRVFIRTTRQRNAAGNFEVGLRTNGGNQSFHTIKHFDPSAVDLVFILTATADMYLIPASEVGSRSSLSFTAARERYRVS